MSFRDAVHALASAPLMWVMLLSGHPARAEEAAAVQPAQPSASATSEACRNADLNGVPPPPGIDCTEYQVRLEQQAKRMESQGKILEQQAKRQELLARIKTANDSATAKKAEPADSASNLPKPPFDQFSQAGAMGEDRMLEVFGDQALIRYRGGEILVRQGQTLPQVGLVEAVSTDGVVLAEGRGRRTLPFFIGERTGR